MIANIDCNGVEALNETDAVAFRLRARSCEEKKICHGSTEITERLGRNKTSASFASP